MSAEVPRIVACKGPTCGPKGQIVEKDLNTAGYNYEKEEFCHGKCLLGPIFMIKRGHHVLETIKFSDQGPSGETKAVEIGEKLELYKTSPPPDPKPWGL